MTLTPSAMTLTPADLVALDHLLEGRLRQTLALPPVLPFSSSVVQIANAGIAAAAFAPGAIDAAAIAAGAIDAGAIDAGAFTAAKFAAAALAGQIVRSIQQVEITIPATDPSADATITGVDVAKTFVVYQGFRYNSNGITDLGYFPQIFLVNTTTVRAQRHTAPIVVATIVRGVAVEIM